MKSPLEAREERWRRRLELAAALPAGSSLVSFTLRMPAPLRLSGEYDRAGSGWFDDLRKFLEGEGFSVFSYEYRVSADGPEGFCTVRGEAPAVKRLAVAFEEAHPFGELTDVDVMDSKQGVQGRIDLGFPPRRCVVCGGEALPCVTVGAHSAEELREAVERIAAREKKKSAESVSCSVVHKRRSGDSGDESPDTQGPKGRWLHRSFGVEAGEEIEVPNSTPPCTDRIADLRAEAAMTSCRYERPSPPQHGIASPAGAFSIGSPATEERLEEISAFIGYCAGVSVLFEAAATPKPGLVTPSSNGAHRDMDYFTFLSSAAALAPFWKRFARLGVFFAAGRPNSLAPQGRMSGSAAATALFRTLPDGADSAETDPSGLLPALREEGVRAERAMFAATGGVNTHKGLVFSLGLLCASAGMLAARERPLSPKACALGAARIVRGIVERDFADAEKKPAEKRTAGERLYLAEAVVGIRGEAERGFPSVVDSALPHLRSALAEGLLLNDALVETLLLLITIVEDTNILARGGREGERLAREAACRALDMGGMRSKEGRDAVQRMDALLAQRRLSPGGSADLLAVTVFLDTLSTLFGRK